MILLVQIKKSTAPGMKDIPYKDRLKQLGLWTLEERRNRADLLEMFKMLIGKSTPCFDSLFERNMLSIIHKRPSS